MLKGLFGGRNKVPATRLPAPNAFVDAAVGGRPARSVSVESVGAKGIVTREVLGRPGESAVLIYATAQGRFRAATRIAAAGGGSTHFDVPKRVDLVGAASGAQKRSSVRLDTIVPGAWRLAPGGKGQGEFLRGTVRDISRGGCALIADRALKGGSMVEVRLALRGDAAPVVLLGEVMRHEEIPTSRKHSHGLRFHGVRPEEDRAIVDFINRKQADLHSRGLA